jgi:hypothetical protein
MTQDEIIEMARNIAKTFGTQMCDENGDTHGEELYVMSIDEIVEAIELVAAKEREVCAKLCDELVNKENSSDYQNAANWCSVRIRARGEKA